MLKPPVGTPKVLLWKGKRPVFGVNDPKHVAKERHGMTVTVNLYFVYLQRVLTPAVFSMVLTYLDVE